MHLWCAELDVPPAPRLLTSLCPEERSRAARFRAPRDRARFVAGRARLRGILSRYLGGDPASIRLHTGAHGKPELPGAPLHFNVAHADALFLCAVALAPVGVDVERVQAFDGMDDVAAATFSAAECAAYDAVPSEERAHAFFACWTRKEAFVKAVGDGLSHPLGDFDVSLAPGEPPRLLAVRGDPAAAGRWSLRAFAPRAGYLAALVVDGPLSACRCWSA